MGRSRLGNMLARSEVIIHFLINVTLVFRHWWKVAHLLQNCVSTGVEMGLY